MADVSFALRIPQDLNDAIRKIADDEGRSINGQIIYMLQSAIDTENPQFALQISVDGLAAAQQSTIKRVRALEDRTSIIEGTIEEWSSGQ